jgi:hypothetical protein
MEDAWSTTSGARGVEPLTKPIRWGLVSLVAVMAMVASLVSAAPAYAATEYLGLRDWSTFASWRAPSGNIYTAQYRASVARNTVTGDIAWRVNTRCLVNGGAATCSRYLAPGLAGYVSNPDDWRRPWGTTYREKLDYKGEWYWQGAWHDPYSVPEFWFFTWGLLSVRWTAPNEPSSDHYICSHDVYYTGSQTRSRSAPTGCYPPT